jgi:polyisoprenyl-phosphate glycosyltransferase
MTHWETDGVASLDLVIPVYNEEAVLPALVARLRNVFSAEHTQEIGLSSVRFLFVDDGSEDTSAEILAREIAVGLPAVVIRLSRNFGHQAAVSAGLDATEADYVAVLDADLQDPPELVAEMISAARRGYDVVFAKRRSRQEGWWRKAGYWLFYRLLSALSDVRIPLDTGDFSLMSRRVVRAMRALPERLRFPRVLRAWVGFSQTVVEFDRPSRLAGRTKYDLSRLYRLATDGLASSSIRPLQVAQVFSVAYLFLILLAGLALLFVPNRFLEARGVFVAVVACLLVLVGNFVQTFCMYILGAYLGRTYLEVKGRPTYVIMETISSSSDTVEVPRRSEGRG